MYQSPNPGANSGVATTSTRQCAVTGRDGGGLRRDPKNAEGRIVRESYVLNTDQVAEAMSETVLRTQLEAAQDPSQGGVLGLILRADRAVSTAWISGSCAQR